MRTSIYATAAAALLLCAPGARASLIGDTVSGVALCCDTSTVVQDLGTVTAGLFGVFAPNIIVGPFLAFGANTLTITAPDNGEVHFLPAAFNGFGFADLTTPFTSASIDAATSVPGFTAADLSISGGQLLVNLQGLTVTGPNDFGLQTETRVVIDITTASSLPEPSTLSLFGAALLALGVAWRRAPISLRSARSTAGGALL